MAKQNTYGTVTPTLSDKAAGIDVSDTGVDANGASKNFLLSAIADLFRTRTETLTNKTLTSPVLNLGADAAGDLYYRNASGLLTRLPKGTDGQRLSLASGVPAWVDAGEWEPYDGSDATVYDHAVDGDLATVTATITAGYQYHFILAGVTHDSVGNNKQVGMGVSGATDGYATWANIGPNVGDSTGTQSLWLARTLLSTSASTAFLVKDDLQVTRENTTTPRAEMDFEARRSSAYFFGTSQAVDEVKFQWLYGAGFGFDGGKVFGYRRPERGFSYD